MTDTTKMLELLALLSMLRDVETLVIVTPKLKNQEIIVRDVKSAVNELELTVRYDDPDDDKLRELADRAKKTHADAVNAVINAVF